MSGKEISVLDTSLRDGAQGMGVSYSVTDKLKIVKLIDRLGIQYIEAGNPFSNPKDKDFFEAARGLKLKSSRLVAFGSTRKPGTDCSEDQNIKALVEAGADTVSIFGKCLLRHVDRVIMTDACENLRMISDSVRHLKSKGKRVIFDAEHFFDAMKDNAGYALECITAAAGAGADIICLCDTNGGTLPGDISKMVLAAAERTDKPLGIHCHNDTGLAAANTLAAIEAGAVHVQGTLLGTGERCGNTCLDTVIPTLELKLGHSILGGERLKSLYGICRDVADVTNLSIDHAEPYIGDAAFSHKGGMHIDAMMKLEGAFEHVDPKTVGNTTQYLFSEVSGKAAVLSAVRKLIKNYSRNDREIARITARLKELENLGYQFESAEGSLELLIRQETGSYKSYFTLKNFSVTESYPSEKAYSAIASLIIEHEGREFDALAYGAGPVDALDRAFRSALKDYFKGIEKVHLTDYKVRVLDPKASTAASVRVLIEATDGTRLWRTVGISADVIQASAMALKDSFDLYLQNLAEQ